MIIKQFINVDKYRRFWQILFWLVLITIAYLTLTPRPPNPISVQHIDKLYHFVTFFGFSLIFYIAFKKLGFYRILILSSLLGILIEFIQIYIPNRGFSIADMVADCIGALVGVFVAHRLISQQSDSSNKQSE
ncbi:VanZ family protein [Aliikangiella maris]|uniref:VanZ family protein n=1 Tax=Aliikangiella maris TaxID=3162458 RepID=A0ABV3MHZ3_9GAMM